MRTKHLLQTLLVALFSILMITDYATASTFGGRTYKVGDYNEINGVGGVVFAVTAFLFTSVTDRLQTGPKARGALLVSSVGIWLAAQCFAGIIL